MKKYKLHRLAPYIMISSLFLSGCGKKSECDLPNRHVHLYKGIVNDDIEIKGYFDDEVLEKGYKSLLAWQPDYMEITGKDAEFYEEVTDRHLFVGLENWDYLYYEMSHNRDYLEFYYEYYTTETYTTTDSDGHTTTHTRQVHHDGWHTNPNDSDNTGYTRLNHYRYYGYRVLYKNGEFVLDRSPSVDDVREILDEYPYVLLDKYPTLAEDGSVLERKYFRYSRYQLPSLRPAQFNCFEHPDLTNKTPYLNKGLSK